MLFSMPVQKAAPATSAAPKPAEMPVEKPVENVVDLDDAIRNFFGTNEK
jgi:hypothetical protein